MSPDFDEIIDRRGTHSSKWDAMEGHYGVSPDDGIPMWVADMDFRPPQAVQAKLEEIAAHGVYGYFGDASATNAAVVWWMKNRHDWEIEDSWIRYTPGVVTGAALCIHAFSEPGDGIVVMSPVYHAFGRIIRAAGRTAVECELANRDGRYEMDFDAWDAQMTGREKVLLLCSPHNPGGRVWSAEELRGVAEFCRRHDLILVSDEIHQDIVFPGANFLPTDVAVPEARDRLIVLGATSKTFNLAGHHTGHAIIPDARLRARYSAVMGGLGISTNAFGMHMVEAAYSPEGAAWVDALVAYLDGNRKLLDEGLNGLPGVTSMPLEATYLAWADFKGTGMEHEELLRRVEKHARIAVNHGPTFGAGGETFLRFNFATPRARVAEAVERLQKAFGDLQ
ncbi:MalY/PatB family protein [Marinovum algicola]|uniref:MalY/PatB family protein n=1 Tax=Marinovum algicola TaxID=42444 RepID=UPI0024BB788F|nr:MalY/PatB family protein [Marinovum algicola]